MAQQQKSFLSSSVADSLLDDTSYLGAAHHEKYEEVTARTFETIPKGTDGIP